MRTILAIDVEPTVETFLEGKGFMLATASGCTKQQLCELTAPKTHEAVLFGTTSRLGPSTIRMLREQAITVPAIQVLKGPRTEQWSLRCANFLRAGGDSVIAAPTEPEEVACILTAVLRRESLGRGEVHTFAYREQMLCVDITRCTVRVNGCPIHLLESEYMLLALLARHPRVAPFWWIEQVLYPDGCNEKMVAILISKIRTALGAAGVMLVTRRNRGYELIGRQP